MVAPNAWVWTAVWASLLLAVATGHAADKTPAKPAPKAPAPAKAAPAAHAAAPAKADAKKVAPAKAAAAPAAVALKLPRRQWVRTVDAKAFLKSLPAVTPIKRAALNLGVEGAVAFAGGHKREQLLKLNPTELARVLYVLEVQAPVTAKAFAAKLKPFVVKYRLGDVDIEPDIQAQVRGYHRLYDAPCPHGKVKRQNSGWPPAYHCDEALVPITDEPEAFASLQAAPRQAVPLENEPKTDDGKPLTSKNAADDRAKALLKFDAQVVPHENLATLPTQFCVPKGGCKKSYDEVVALLYPGVEAKKESLPVFCAPRKKDKDWDLTTYDCATNWSATLGTWKPWSADGRKAPEPPKPGELPPAACFGDRAFFERAVVPAKTSAERFGFYCRKRIFRMLASPAPMNQADIGAENALMCIEMRNQVWNATYQDLQPNINQRYIKWCQDEVKAGRRKSDLCPKAEKGDDGNFIVPQPPFMLLSREELLYFFGHRELFCRGDREGLTHFLFNNDTPKEWAPTFTCGVARGVIESGPFEEGVQACAVVPFAGEAASAKGLSPKDIMARLHCWQFNRPTCEEISADKKGKLEEKEALRKANVFDLFDTLRNLRRTHNAAVYQLIDPKDVEKLVDYSATLSYQDTEKDEGVFGVKEFCRVLDGSLRKLQCGFTKDTIARFYELHQFEKPDGCTSGVCVRGAYQRGYACGLFESSEYFKSPDYPRGKPFWMCGVDPGVKGRDLLARATAICLGGARTKSFLSAKGDTSSLQCYSRAFKWGETQTSEEISSHLDWPGLVKKAAETVENVAGVMDGGGRGVFDEWLIGGTLYFTEHAQSLAFNDQIMKLVEDDWGKSIDLKKLPAGMTADHAKKKNARMQNEYDTRMAKLRKDKTALILEPAKLQHAAAETLRKALKADAAALVAWAAKAGHTLGHRTSLFKALMQSDVPAVKDLRALSFKPYETDNWYFEALGSKTLVHAWPINPADRPKFKLRSATKAKELNDLLQEVRDGSRIADDKWYQEFRIAATEDNVPRIEAKELAVALRVHLLFEVLALARKAVLKTASDYAWSVLSTARRADNPWLSRLELHEAARDQPMAQELKGNVFCVPIVNDSFADGRTRYACASSPLLVAGTVELRTVGKSELSEADQHKRRENYQMNWCYGGTKGAPLFGYRRSATVLDPAMNIDSPYVMKVPGRSIDPKTHRVLSKEKSSSANWLKCAAFQFHDVTWQAAVPMPKGKAGAPVAKGPAAAPAAKTGVKTQSVDDVLRNARSSDPDHEVTAKDREKAQSESGDLANRAGGLLSEVLSIVAPDLKNLTNIVENAAQISTDFLERWRKRLHDKAKAGWDAGEKKLTEFIGPSGPIEKAKAELQKSRDALLKAWKDTSEAVDKAQADFRQAVKEAASERDANKKKTLEEKASEKEKAYAEAKKVATKTISEREADVAKKETVAVKTAVEDLNKLKTGIQNENKKMQGSGELVSGMIDELTQELTNRVHGLLGPLVGNLVARGFSYIRTILEPVLGAVIGMIGSIPFVGGALAAVAQVAFTLVMNKIEEAVTNGVTDLVAGFLTPIIRKAVGGLMQPVKTKLALMIRAECPSQVCPPTGQLQFSALPAKDQWLERALACKVKPFIDDNMLREAGLARARLQRAGEEMRQNVAVYARTFADPALARHGYSYDSFMQAAKEPSPAFLASVAHIASGLATKRAGMAPVPGQVVR